MKPLKRRSLHTTGAKLLLLIFAGSLLLLEYSYSLPYFDLSSLRIFLEPESLMLIRLSLFTLYILAIYWSLMRDPELLPEVLVIIASPAVLESFYSLNLAAALVLLWSLLLSRRLSTKVKLAALVTLTILTILAWILGMIVLDWNVVETLVVLGILILALRSSREFLTNAYLTSLAVSVQLLLLALAMHTLSMPSSKARLIDNELLTYKQLIYGTSYVYCSDANVWITFDPFCTTNLSIARYAVVRTNQNFSNPWFKPLVRGRYYTLYGKILLNVSYRVCGIGY